MRFGHREEKLPPFKSGAGASCGNAIFVDGLDTVKRRIRSRRNALLTELGVYIVVNPPDPAGKILHIRGNRIGLDILAKTLATVFTREDVGEHGEEPLKRSSSSVRNKM
jgi:hypothetical protein